MLPLLHRSAQAVALLAAKLCGVGVVAVAAAGAGVGPSLPAHGAGRQAIQPTQHVKDGLPPHPS